MLTLRYLCADHRHAMSVGIRSMARWVPLYAALAAIMFVSLVAANGQMRVEDWNTVFWYGLLAAAATAVFRYCSFLIADRIEKE